MKKIQLLEITTLGKPELKDDEGNVTQEAVAEVSHVFVENGHTYEEDLRLSKLEIDEYEVIKQDKEGKPEPTEWEKKSESEQLNDYIFRKSHAYGKECSRIQLQFPNRIFVVRIVET